MEGAEFFQNFVSEPNEDSRGECFLLFQKDEEGCLNAKEFDSLARSLLADEGEQEKELPVTLSADVFLAFDENRDGVLDADEFEKLWTSWIKPLLRPVTALLVIDVQNDFIEGSLAMERCPAKQDGLQVVTAVNDLLNEVPFDVVVYSLDWHPEEHISFFENLHKRELCSDKCSVGADEAQPFDTVVFEGPPEMEQKLWPRHCLQESWGAELHPELRVSPDAVFVRKGTDVDVDSYSAFFDNMKVSQTPLHEELQKRGVTHVFVCGLAFDYCVGFTALDAAELGYATTVVEDACRGTDDVNISAMKSTLVYNKCVLAGSGEVKRMVEGRDRKIEFAYNLGRVAKESDDAPDEENDENS